MARTAPSCPQPFIPPELSSSLLSQGQLERSMALQMFWFSINSHYGLSGMKLSELFLKLFIPPSLRHFQKPVVHTRWGTELQSSTCMWRETENLGEGGMSVTWTREKSM